MIRVPHHRFNHKGGQLQVGADGMLYAGFGDGGGGGDPDENAQDLGEFLGKLIRIDPRADGGYSVPASNPFRNRSGARPEVYAYGLRNPYRFSFDRRRGSLRSATWDRTTSRRSTTSPAAPAAPPRGGYNFGWDVFEGRSPYESGSAPGAIRPVLQHTHDEGFCSITGGYVIRDRSLGRGWTGRYVYGDFCEGTIRLAHLRRPNAPNAPHAPARVQPRLIRRGRPRPRLRGLAGRPDLPHRPPLTLGSDPLNPQGGQTPLRVYAPRFTQTVLFSR